MVDVKDLKSARLIAIGHIVVGILLIVFGIVDRVEGYFWTGEGCFGIWCGVWMIVTGSLGIPGSNRERNSSSQAFAAAFMGCAITSAVFGGIVIICFSISIAMYRTSPWYEDDFYQRYWYNYDAEMAVTVITLILGIVEFGIGIWAAVLCCNMNACQCCAVQGGQAPSMVYVSNQGMVYGAGGAPMGIPVQTAGGVVMVPVSSSGGVGGHPQTVQMPGGGVMQVVTQPQMYQAPISGAVSMQPQMIQVPTSGAGAVSMQPQMVQVPTSGAQGGPAPMVQVPPTGNPQGPPEFVRVTTDGPVPEEKVPLP